MSVLRYLRSKIPTAHHEARARDKEEFFDFAKTGSHGFPAKPSAVAHDPELNLLAIATHNGSLRVYGGAGVELEGSGEGMVRVLWLPGQGRLLTQAADQSFTLWEINEKNGASVLDQVKSVKTEDRLKKISAVTLRKVVGEDGDISYTVLVGTESGNVYALDTPALNLSDYIIYQDAVIHNIPDDYRVEAGPVASIAVHPNNPAHILLGYGRGLIVLWDAHLNQATHTYVSQQGLECVCWSDEGEKFMSSHADGSYVVWSSADSSKPMQSPNIPFGPFPCLPIETLILKPVADGGEAILAFTGGMPKASYGERHTVGLERGSQQLVLDFTSAVVGLVTVDNNEGKAEALAVLCEEELVMVDLVSEGWPQYRLPYLIPVHASPITAAHHVAGMSAEVLETLVKAGESQPVGRGGPFSKRDWPVSGGQPGGLDESMDRDVLITGHEDGSVKLWRMGGGGLNLVLSLQTAALFADYSDPNAKNEDDEEWPPFKKVGCFDPFSDDPRYGIQRVWMDGASGLLVVGATGGQTTLWKPADEAVEMDSVTAHKVWVVEEGSSFVWKGEPALEPRGEATSTGPGFALQCLVQLSPPAAVTAIAAQPDWGLIGIGTGYGFALFDYVQNKSVFTKCLINPEDVAAVEQTTGRWKSMKKSIRQSFRQVNRRARRRMQQAAAEEAAAAGERMSPTPRAEGEDDIPAMDAEEEKPASPKKDESPKKSPKRVTVSSPRRTPEPDDLRPVERAIVARCDSPAGAGEQMTSLVRSLVFANTHVLNASSTTPSFWVGTNGGAVQIHTLELPEKREEDEVKCTLAKEIQLQHRAPVLGIFIVDGGDFPLSAPSPAAKETDDSHRVILCSEEQVKSFSLPGLKPGRSKFKMTALEGSRVRKVSCATLESKSEAGKWEAFLVVMTNQGDVEAFSTHSARRYLKAPCIEASDMFGINSTVLSGRGEGLYLGASSEWRRFACGAKGALRPHCLVALPEGARPALPLQEEPSPDDHKDEEEEPAAGVADLTLGSGDVANTTGNTTMPTDITMDSIRDYTTNSSAAPGDHMETVAETMTETVTEVTETPVTETPVTESEPITNGEEATEAMGVVTVTTKTTKTTIVATNGNGHAEEEPASPPVNGAAGEEDIVALKAANQAAAAAEEIQ